MVGEHHSRAAAAAGVAPTRCTSTWTTLLLLTVTPFACASSGAGSVNAGTDGGFGAPSAGTGVTVSGALNASTTFEGHAREHKMGGMSLYLSTPKPKANEYADPFGFEIILDFAADSGFAPEAQAITITAEGDAPRGLIKQTIRLWHDSKELGRVWWLRRDQPGSGRLLLAIDALKATPGDNYDYEVHGTLEAELVELVSDGAAPTTVKVKGRF